MRDGAVHDQNNLAQRKEIMTPEQIEELVDDLYTQFEELTRNSVDGVETFEKVMSGLCGRFEWAR